MVCCPILRSALLCGTEPRNPADPNNTNGLVPREEGPRVGHSGVWVRSGSFCLQSGNNLKQILMACPRSGTSCVRYHFRSRSCSQIPPAFLWQRVGQIRDTSWTRTSSTGSPTYLSYAESSTEAFSPWEHFSFCCCRVAIDSQSMPNLFLHENEEKITRSAKGRAVGPLPCHDWDTPSMEARGRRGECVCVG